MNIFGVGPLEIVLILLLGILVLGPEGMVEAGRKLGKFMRQVVTSQWWRGVQDGVNEVQNLPYRLMREAELEELEELKNMGKDALPSKSDLDPWKGLPNRPTPVNTQGETETEKEEQSQPEEEEPGESKQES